MANDTLLVKPELPADFIDTSVGEAYVVRDSCLHHFSDVFESSKPHKNYSWDYPMPAGLPELVKLLEDKHKAKIIITNGAKQGLAACFYALKQFKVNTLGMHDPYWALIPPLAKEVGLDLKICDNLTKDGRLIVAPNNPDGSCLPYKELDALYCLSKIVGVPLIHDAVYYTHSYLPEDYELGPVGDMQIFSLSKMFGLSSLRLGYIVCHNDKYYKSIQDYIEMFTVGVSSLSQQFAFDLLSSMTKERQLAFEKTARESLLEAKKIFKSTINPNINVPDSFESSYGMFGWFEASKETFTKAKINVVEGSHFGDPSKVRMNLAFKPEIMKEIVKRLNG